MKQILVGDFETTVYEGQTETEVWASALVPLNTEDVVIHNSIEETFKYLKKLNANVVVYYHNLKFDGEFWLSFLYNKSGLKEARNLTVKDEFAFQQDKHMYNGTFKYTISAKGQWYSIKIKHRGHIIEIRDSLKLLPFSVAVIGESFNTKHKKLEMVYEGVRYSGCEITPEEREYIKNDVLVVKEALEFMFLEGHNKLTIGACCVSEFKKTIGVDDMQVFFPDLSKIELNGEHGSDNADQYIRRSYKGAWCYVVPEKAGKIYYKGLTADVNSLYPSVMHSDSGNYYPVGTPHFWAGNNIPEKCNGKYFFVRIKTRFYLKEGYLPCIQIKGNHLYNPTEWLKTSDVWDNKTEKYYDKYYSPDGELHDTRVEMTLTCTDYQLIKEHYDLIDFEILDGAWFFQEIGLFDNYINIYREKKMNSKGAMRTLAKLFLNNLYGKFATSSDSSFKRAELENGVIKYSIITENNKDVLFIPVGSAITSYAREFTIRTAQKNYHGVDKSGFIYADTDSIHCDIDESELIDVPTHPNAFNHWSIECNWDIAIFHRQKTYVEHIVKEDGENVEPHYKITCAGMPKYCKELLVHSFEGTLPEKCTEEEKDFVLTERDIRSFTTGLVVPSKLRPKRLRGGIVLEKTDFTMRS